MPRFRDMREKTDGKMKKKESKKEKKATPKADIKIEKRALRHVSDPYSVLKFVLMTEKCVRMIETENKLVFIVDRKAGKSEIKNAFETAFGSKVNDVNVAIDQKARKKAFIKLKEPGAAGDIAVRLGII